MSDKPLRVRSAADAWDRMASWPTLEEQNRTWGAWSFDPTYLVLYAHAGGYEYCIRLDECKTSAQVLDWICQIAAKSWGASVVGDLVHAFNYLLYPQANLCSWGRSHELQNPGEYALEQWRTQRAPAQAPVGTKAARAPRKAKRKP